MLEIDVDENEVIEWNFTVRRQCGRRLRKCVQSYLPWVNLVGSSNEIDLDSDVKDAWNAIQAGIGSAKICLVSAVPRDEAWNWRTARDANDIVRIYLRFWVPKDDVLASYPYEKSPRIWATIHCPFKPALTARLALQIIFNGGLDTNLIYQGPIAPDDRKFHVDMDLQDFVDEYGLAIPGGLNLDGLPSRTQVSTIDDFRASINNAVRPLAPTKPPNETISFPRPTQLSQPQQVVRNPELPDLYPGFDVIHVESGPAEWGYDTVWCGKDGSELSTPRWVGKNANLDVGEADCLTCSARLRFIRGLPPPGFQREHVVYASKLPSTLRAKFPEEGRPGWRGKCPACGKTSAMETLGPYEVSRGPLQGESGSVNFRMGQMDVYQGYRYKERQDVTTDQRWVCKYCGKVLFDRLIETREKSGFTQWNPQDRPPDDNL